MLGFYLFSIIEVQVLGFEDEELYDECDILGIWGLCSFDQREGDRVKRISLGLANIEKQG